MRALVQDSRQAIATHRWTGTPHNSPSEKVVAGVVVGTNPMPGVGVGWNNLGPGMTRSIEAFDGKTTVKVTAGPTASGGEQQATIHQNFEALFEMDREVTVHAFSYEPESNTGTVGTRIRLGGGMFGAGRGGEDAPYLHDKGRWVHHTLDVKREVDSSALLNLQGNTMPGDVTYWRLIALLDRGIPPFDGDTPSHYVFWDKRKVTHRWTGTPGNSTSEQVIDGVVAGKNGCPNPRAVLEGANICQPNSGGYVLDRGIAPPEPSPAGILTATGLGRTIGAGTGVQTLYASVYAVDGFYNNSPARSGTYWVYPTVDTGLSSSGLDVQIPGNQWSQISYSVPENTHYGFRAYRADEQNYTGDERIYTTQILTQLGSNSLPSDYFDGDTPTYFASPH